jgi:hypothetical protein
MLPWVGSRLPALFWRFKTTRKPAIQKMVVTMAEERQVSVLDMWPP